ncbi:MAG: hypothetical protein FRX49_12292 [Trebouxia sp. A1-2]|nr:MAG: hypothetical protein FRX49_12292 [Trebouxia sp. A1-2]
MYLDPGMLLIIRSPVEAHAPHHFEPVLHQHLDEGKLVKVQQVHQCYAVLSSNESADQYLDFIHFTLLISIFVTLELNCYPNVIIQGVPRGSRLIIRLAEVGDEAAHILERSSRRAVSSLILSGMQQPPAKALTVVFNGDKIEY